MNECISKTVTCAAGKGGRAVRERYERLHLQLPQVHSGQRTQRD